MPLGRSFARLAVLVRVWERPPLGRGEGGCGRDVGVSGWAVEAEDEVVAVVGVSDMEGCLVGVGRCLSDMFELSIV